MINTPKRFSPLARFADTQLRMQISRKTDACSSGARDNELEIASLEREEAGTCVSRARKDERRKERSGPPIVSASAPRTYDRGGDVV